VYYLPQSFVNNSQAAFEENGQTLANLNTSAPYLGPQLAAGQFGYEVYLFGPWQNHFDANVTKTTTIRERFKVEFTAQFLDLLNLTNFQLPGTLNLSSTSLGQTTSAYRDLSNAQDPGARVIEFRMRVDF
jgi:hypothetical protein